MGYTHSWDIYGWDTLQWQTAWPKLIEDIGLILAASDVLVSGPTDDTLEVTPPLADVNEGIFLNGVADDSHHPFQISPACHGNFCKTQKRPYDLVVVCILLRAYMLAPKNVKVSSDGDWDAEEWKNARDLYKSIWPDEVIWCPWKGIPVDENGKYIGENGLAHFGVWTMLFDAHGEYHGPKKWLLSEDGRKLTPKEWLYRKSREPLGTDSEGPNKAETSANITDPVETVKLIKLDFPGPVRSRDVISTVEGLDLAPIKQSLLQCDKDDTHANCKATAIEWTEFPGVRFRLIDTKRKCIIDTGADVPPFMALSYVWGGDQPKLMSSTAALLQYEGGLDKVWANIPATIRDSIAVCEELGERYLWVDALCIMQDSTKDKRLQILRMRQVYASAKCTIAAVCSTGAKEGLLPRAKSQSAAECRSEAELDELLDKAPWSSRAWCYQEKVLSHRMIFFTVSGIFLQCQEGTFDSRAALLPPRPSRSVDKFNHVGAILLPSSADDLESYLSAVEYFNKRKLTIKDDKMNAFQGVLQRYRNNMNGQASSFDFGLPICAFDQTFCWRAVRHDPEARNDSFPSWSWLGWDVPITFERNLIEHARTSQIIYSGNHAKANPKSLIVRKPADASVASWQRSFGFPASDTGNLYFNGPERGIYASVSDLRVAKDLVDMDGSNGLYPVYGMKCSQQPPSTRGNTPPKTMTLLEYLMEPLPEIKWMDEETAAAPSLPAKKQTSDEYDIGEHADHHNCEAHMPVGHIWLDKRWRGGQPEHCVMEFMALHGEKEMHYDGDGRVNECYDGKQHGEKWIITMLMLTQRMSKKDAYWANERVQVMDCRLTEQEWAKTGADQRGLKMV